VTVQHDGEGLLVRKAVAPAEPWCGSEVVLRDGTSTGCQFQPGHEGGCAAGFTEDGVLLDFPIRGPHDAPQPPAWAVQVVEFAVSKLHLEPGEILVLVPDREVVDSVEVARQLQEALGHALAAWGFTNGVLVLPPGSELTTMRGAEQAPAG
jgi:hypothetical protein